MKNTIIISLALIIFSSCSVKSQQTPSNEVMSLVDEPAKPMNGMKDLFSHIATTLKYPKQAKKEGIEGKVFIEFIVNKSGEIESTKIAKGIGNGCNEAALAAFESYEGKWSAPIHEGKTVKQKIVLPVMFKLGKDKHSKI